MYLSTPLQDSDVTESSSDESDEDYESTVASRPSTTGIHKSIMCNCLYNKLQQRFSTGSFIIEMKGPLYLIVLVIVLWLS